MHQRNETSLHKPNEASILLHKAPIFRPKLLLMILMVILGFGFPLYSLFHFAIRSELYSYTLLVPLVCIYLFVLDRKNASSVPFTPNRGMAGLLIATAVCSLALLWLANSSEATLAPQDALALTTFSFVLFVAGTCAWNLSKSDFRRAAFPLAFLLFMVPFPVAAEHAIETFLQRGSAPPAFWLLKLAGTPVFREDMVFQLPGITLQIAPECSGIRSSLVLFMTSLVAGHLFLKSPWSRALLALVVIPLALVRNGFRVFTIGQLCVSVGPHMIDSAIHHQGGPIFFALSLIPFFALLFFLIKRERRVNTPQLKPQSLS